ncbi:hypothetical protein ABW21_db0201157 [Orbilia brochopaga]|nr:hypothetical protein ABW21_db0201157 [Drechslerella brochopaga]
MRLSSIFPIAALIAAVYATYEIEWTNVPGTWLTEPDIAPNCDRWCEAFNAFNCDFIAAMFGIKKEDFLAWNPNLARDCLDLKTGWGLCIHTRAVPTATAMCTQQLDLPHRTCSASPETTIGP